MKKLFSIIISLACVLAVSLPVYANDAPLNTSAECPAISDCSQEMTDNSYPSLNSDNIYHLTYDTGTDDPGVIAPEPFESTRECREATVAEAPEREGYEFTGWYILPEDDDEPLMPGDTICVFADVTLYARWQEKKDTPVAVMYLCASDPHSQYLFGHAWICIENISSSPLTVGSQTLEPGEIMSAGLHNAKGLCYNREMEQFKGETVSAREYTLTASDLEKLNSELADSGWSRYELFTHNCTNFATAVWSGVTGQRFITLCFPFIIRLQIALGNHVSLAIGG